MKTFVMTMTLAAVMALTLVSAGEQTVGGTWRMAVTDAMSMRMVLVQKGKKITGTLYNPHSNPIALSGEFEHGRIRFIGSSTGGEWDYSLAAIGEMAADGSLAGTLTSNVGDMKWTATRAAEANRTK